jgi:hypothetical protein
MQPTPAPPFTCSQKKNRTENKNKTDRNKIKITAYQINLINSDSSGQISEITFHNFLLLPAVSLELLVLP